MLTLDQKKASLIWSKCHLQINDAQATDSYHNRNLFNKTLKVMLHETICNNDFQGNNVGALLKQFETIPQQCCNALLVVTNCPLWHRLKGDIGSLSLHSCRLSPFPWLFTRQILPWHRYLAPVPTIFVLGIVDCVKVSRTSVDWSGGETYLS